MHVVYVGEYDEVQIVATGQVAKKGEPIEVESDLGKSLLEQSDVWQRPKASKK